MSYRLVLFGVLFFFVTGCSKESTEMSGSSPSVVPDVQIAPSDELWDTDLTYGHLPDPNSTGIERGRQVYKQFCAICHAEGVGMAGTESLQRSFKAMGVTDRDPILENRTDLNAITIETFVREGVKSMPYFRKTEVSDEDLALMIEYLTRNNPPTGQ